MCNFQMDFSDWWLRHLLWNCPNMNVTGLHWWSVNIGSGSGLVPSGNKPLPEPMLTQILPYGVTRPQWVKKCHIDWLVFKGYTQHILRTVRNLQSYRRNLLASFPGYRQPPWVHTDPCLPPPHPPHLQQANMAAQSPLAHRTDFSRKLQKYLYLKSSSNT